MATTKTWFITGVSTGFGKELAEYCLRHGDQVAATFRQQEQADEFTQKAGENGRGFVCDVVSEQQVQAAVQAAIQHFGQLDVVVNNAGYGSLGSIEEIDEAEVQRQFDVNVFGPLRVLRAVLPHLRERKSGHVLNITSIGGLKTFPGVGVYNASKFALEALGESLAQQVGPLGIKVTNIEPSGFRTDWAGRSASFVDTAIDDYRATVGENLKGIQSYSGRQPGDPQRAAKIMFDLVRQENPPLHLPLGKAAVKGAREKFTNLVKELEQVADLGDSADYPAGE
ncbi:NAD(P)-dependent dehydrogenase (short-subunit alcohol dehydrogenase family) [Hymenobacter luteus]|uniref:NAD(P)-dependent dehydrogenase (Short-subunit alcohol dehydrogenase family) n=2 Tax=Hymenobacter TaxID=89966 RepID=A0A7W9SXB3_9BACT|nr:MULTISPECIES: oxidoreductase [Hymenobacter]MBB4600110.1 NAD(P)-dependent dehydrogenase (short-subunit alcohol dehydrogenase family) [Hymenobacter latericoloratus]MBB6057580.1 NAD(P)-dependent dehydrogenase (short-subunit alcohol dehydrogenase family) [Hymenobacter luteus]